MALSMTREMVTLEAKRLGCDLVGFAGTRSLEEGLAEEHRPSRIAVHMRSLVVVAKKSYAGFIAAHHAGTKQFWGGRLIKRLDETCLKLADVLEKHGVAAFPVSSLMVNVGERKGLDLCPAGQGSPLLKAAAVQAGLGTLGLNLMLLTREFGPRIYLGGVLTDLELECGRPLESELCLGLEQCGRCAAVCPEDAIPRAAPRDAPLRTYRNLDAASCARSSQPFGPIRFSDHLKEIIASRSKPEDVWSVLGGRVTGALWQEMLMVKDGSFTGCSACVQSCPVGADYDRAQKQGATVGIEVARTVTAQGVEVERLPKEGEAS